MSICEGDLEISFACAAARKVGLSFLRSSGHFCPGFGKDFGGSLWRRSAGVLVM